MPVSMYAISVPVMQRTMRNLIAVLDKAEAHAKAKKIEEAVVVNARLALDMFPLKRQVQIASDTAKLSVSRLAGTKAPRWEDNEETFAELKGRLQKSIDFLATFEAAQIDSSEDRDISLTLFGQPAALKGHCYLLNHALPNFFFHVTNAYNILRLNGVEVGKRDYLGAL